jgi:cell division protein FtsQ
MKIFIKILLLLLWIALAAGTVLVMSFSVGNHGSKHCLGVECNIDFRGNQPLLTNREVINGLTTKFGKLQSKPINLIDIAAITRWVKSNPYLENTDVLMTVEGKILIKARQCTPLVRYITQNGSQHFIADNGRIMPVRFEFPYKILIADGSIKGVVPDEKNIFSLAVKNKPVEPEVFILQNLHYVSQLIHSDPVLNSLIEQIYTGDNGKMLMVTKAGSHLIEFGDTSLAAEKFENLKCFYKEALPKTGWKKYRKISLEYKNQIVCTK